MIAGSVFARRRAALLGLSVATMAMIPLAVPALAAYDVDRVTARHPNWVIGINDRLGGCLASGTVPGDTRVSFGRAAPGAEPFLALSNPKWASLAAGETYTLSFVFDRGRDWTYSGTGLAGSARPGVVVRGVPSAFIDDFARSSTLRILFQGREVERLDLAGTRAATRAVQACQRHRSRPPDPFATAQGAPPVDPFATALAAPQDPFATSSAKGAAASPPADSASMPAMTDTPDGDGLMPVDDLDLAALEGWWREVGRADTCDAQAGRAVIAMGRWVAIDGVPEFDSTAEWRVGLNGFDCMVLRGVETESGYVFDARCNHEDSPVYSQSQSIALNRQRDDEAYVLTVGGAPFGLYVPCESESPAGGAVEADPVEADGPAGAGAARDDAKVGKDAD